MLAIQPHSSNKDAGHSASYFQQVEDSSEVVDSEVDSVVDSSEEVDSSVVVDSSDVVEDSSEEEDSSELEDSSDTPTV